MKLKTSLRGWGNPTLGNSMKQYWHSLIFAVVFMVSDSGAQSIPQVSVQSGDTSNRALPDDNLSYPVKVTLEGSQGSGFFVNGESATFFVTAKHVLYNHQTGKIFGSDLFLESFSKNLADPTKNLFKVNLKSAEEAGLLKQHADADVAVLKIANVESKEGSGRVMMQTVPQAALLQVAKDGITGINQTDSIRKLADVQISNDVYIFGFPNSIGLENIPQVDFDRPLLRKGIVAGINQRARTIIIDCQTFPGNSGGLVLETETEAFQRRYRAIGIVSQYVPFDNGKLRIAINPTVLNSGYSVVVPMDYVLELISQF